MTGDEKEAALAEGVRANIVGGDMISIGGHHNTTTIIRGSSRESLPQPVPERTVILILAANPDGTANLRLDEEQRAIGRAIQEGAFRERLEVRVSPAVRIGDLQHALLQHRPAVVHFSGHGSARDGIVFSDEHGWPHPVPPRGLTALFGIRGVGDAISCVVLNACSTKDQAAAIAAHVPCVIGMSHLVPDETAIAFAEGFYRAVAFGQSVRAAFDLGVNAAVLKGLAGADLPHLIADPGVAEKLTIV